MAKKGWPIIPATLVLIGATIGASSAGKAPRIPFNFGEYKEITAIAFIVVGIFLFFLWQRQSDNNS